MPPSKEDSEITTQKTHRVDVLADILRLGGIIVFPTETVYGIGASSLNHSACRRIYAIKNRPIDNPLIVHCYDIAQVEKYAHLPNQGRILWEKFAPGPLTLVLKKKSDAIFSADMPTIACRIPSHRGFRGILQHLGSPISAPSANLSGKPSITRVRDAIATFEGIVEGILLEEENNTENQNTASSQWNLSRPHENPRESRIGLESTVLDLTGEIPRILRPGFIEKESMEKVLGSPIEVPQAPEHLSPGVKYKHYSPEGIVHLFQSSRELADIINRERLSPSRISILHYNSTILGPSLSINANTLSVTSNQQYAEHLYSFFIDSDNQNIEHIFCEEPHPGNLYAALMNRLRKVIEN